VFELIQNAEDSNYTEAMKRKEAPFISFKIYPKRIVVDSNEDGFTDDNVRAICDIGRSSKKGAHGYIGEKGIGFKSVFMVASKAYIQSGPFSFYFKHGPSDSGVGMINPIWRDHPEERPDNSITRITLTLHDPSVLSEIAPQKESVIQQFKRLKRTLLLFLKKLKRIEVSIYDDDDTLSSCTTYSSHYEEDTHRATLTETCLKNGTLEKETEQYHVIKKQVYGLPRHDNRTYADDVKEEERPDATAEVVLAFPIDPYSIPVIKTQHVFAFLPIREYGFSVRSAKLILSKGKANEDAVLNSVRFRYASQPGRYHRNL
jgi:hypothetical protein